MYLARIAAFTLLLCSGCATVPERTQPPAIDLPAKWTGTAGKNNQPVGAWLIDFTDPQLERVIQEALANNPNLRASAARIDQAIAEARITGAQLSPQSALGLGGSRQRISTFGPQSTGGIYFENFNLDLNLSWELDLWGRLRNQHKSALAQTDASEADYQAARLSLAAQTAKAWFNFTEASAQVELARKNAKAYQETLKALESRYQRGLSNGLELRQIRTEVANARAAVATRQRAQDLAARSVEILLGRYPSASIEASSQWPQLPKAIPAGIPSELLLRRPDLIAAERRLAASEKQLSAARKEWLPRLSLTTAGGTASSQFKDLLNSDFRVGSLAGNLTQPIFQGGRIRASIDRSHSLREQAAANYHNVTLQAFLEVETTLAADALLRRESKQLQRAAAEAEQAETLAWKRYSNGTLDFLNVLSSQRAAASARSAYLTIRNRLVQNRIDLHLALGGPLHREK